jgi:tetratricopeptide (TPR) repeat protein
MTDDLITSLGQIHAIRVISRTSVMQYKRTYRPLPQIARELSVDAVIEGTVLRSGNRVRITVQLIDATSDKHLWAQKYEGDTGNVISLQDEVAREIAEQVKVGLTREETVRLRASKPVNTAAYDAYLRGRSYWDRWLEGGCREAIPYFNQALAIDPNYGQAYAGIADCYSVQTAGGSQARLKAKAFASKALELDASLVEAHTTLGSILDTYDWDSAGAEQEFNRAIQLNPGYALAHLWYGEQLYSRGRWDEGLAQIKEAQSLDPLSMYVNEAYGIALYFTHHYGAARNQLNGTLELYPDSRMAHFVLGNLYEEERMYDKAIAEFQAYGLQVPDSVIVGKSGYGRWNEYWRFVLRDANERSKKGQLLAFVVASRFAAMGDKEKALLWLDRAYKQHDFDLIFIAVEPKFKKLHSEVRYEALARSVGRRT